MRRFVFIGITGVILLMASVVLPVLIMHFESLRLPNDEAVVVRINGDEFLISNCSDACVGQVVIHYENENQDTSYKLQIWSLRGEETRRIRVPSLKERGFRITAIQYNGEIYIKREDS